jgi:hypothetical protein
VILLTDDDEEDVQMTVEALTASPLSNDVRTTRDGEELMDYLLRRGQYVEFRQPGTLTSTYRRRRGHSCTYKGGSLQKAGIATLR